MIALTVALAIAGAALGGCHDHPAVGAPLAGGGRATAMLVGLGGGAVGRATASEVGGGVRVTIDGHGLPAGIHGAHIQATGSCAAARPDGRGRALPDLVIGRDGRGTAGVVIAGATMAGLLDAGGAALVVDAGPPDPMAAASGGGTIACGMFAAI